MTQRKSQHEIIDFIANHYNTGNRAVEAVGGGNYCRYNTPDGKQCAFAIMCIEPETLPEGVGASAHLTNLGAEILKPEFRGYNFHFYNVIQHFHDKEEYWNENGLTDKGKKKVAELKIKYNQE